MKLLARWHDDGRAVSRKEAGELAHGAALRASSSNPGRAKELKRWRSWKRFELREAVAAGLVAA